MGMLDPPFGPLNAAHYHLIANAQPLTWAQAPYLFLPAVGLLWPQAMLLFYRDTRPYRMALGAAGLALLYHAWTSYRLTQIEYNAFNNGLFIAGIHLAGKYLEFALLDEPIRDPYRLGPAPRPVYLAAFDLCINSRMVGLGSVGLDHSSGPPNAAAAGPAARPPPERWLAHPAVGRTRGQALRRHALLCALQYVALDTMLSLIRLTGRDTLANTAGVPGALHRFSHGHRFSILPPVVDLAVPPLVPELVAEACVPLVIWTAIGAGYHLFALVFVGSGLYPVAAWEADMFDAPWRADSVLDVWGRRWHQLFRHHFILASTLTLRALRLPESSATLLPLIFLYSGLVHALGELTTHPTPDPARVLVFFILSGLGAAAEVLFKRATGKKVGGTFGRMWAYCYMFAIGRLACGAWFDSGIAGTAFLPEGGPGEYVARAMLGTVIGVEPLAHAK